MSEPVILEAVRSPFGRRKGALREIRPDTLLSQVIRGVLDRSGLPAEDVGDVIVGCVSQVGEQGANIARLAALLADLPVSVPGVSLNRMCGSSQQAIHFAAQAVAAGDLDYVLAGGVESMSRVPIFSDVTLMQADFKDFSSLNPALFERFDLIHQGESAERVAEHWQIARRELDEFAMASHRKASTYADLQTEILPLAGKNAEGQALTLKRDEGVRAVLDPVKIAQLAPAFRPPGDGVITAANSSQISDGASAVLIGDREKAEANGLRPRARFRAKVAIGSDPVMQLTGVIPATELALRRAGLTLGDIDWFEINEAFASVVLAWSRELKVDLDRVNPWGGAIAHGHPLGATGGGLMAKMLTGLEQSGKALGLQVMCIGHGMATATVIERI